MGKRVPAAGEGKRGEAGYFGYLLRQAGGAYRARAERALAPAGLTLPQFSVLTMLAAYPGSSGADVARLALLTPQTVSVILANLERLGAIGRQPHEVHGRIVRLEVTAQGRALLAAARQRVHALEAELARGLTPEEAAVVKRWLAGVAAGG